MQSCVTLQEEKEALQTENESLKIEGAALQRRILQEVREKSEILQRQNDGLKESILQERSVVSQSTVESTPQMQLGQQAHERVMSTAENTPQMPLGQQAHERVMSTAESTPQMPLGQQARERVMSMAEIKLAMSPQKQNTEFDVATYGKIASLEPAGAAGRLLPVHSRAGSEPSSHQSTSKKNKISKAVNSSEDALAQAWCAALSSSRPPCVPDVAGSGSLPPIAEETVDEPSEEFLRDLRGEASSGSLQALIEAAQIEVRIKQVRPPSGSLKAALEQLERARQEYETAFKQK